MKTKLLLICSTFFLTGISFSQTVNLGEPVSWNGKILNERSVQTQTMPGYNQVEINAEDAINDHLKDAPWRFGYKYNTNFTLENSGTWTELPNGDRIWRIGIKCPNAMTVNLLFENLFIPEGAHMYMYDIDHTNKIGAFTSKNNNSAGVLGSELIHGEHIILEYFEPARITNSGHLTIANVIHGYRGLNTIQSKLTKALNSSGDCNIDVNCPLGNGWENQIRSVAMIVVNGSGICTGALINNTCDNGTPYFLTANHCLSGANVGSTLNWAFRFNWESPLGTESCATTANSVDPGAPYDQTAYGATVLVQGTQADHALLEINNMTVNDAETWNAYYAGWNNDDTDGSITQATGIHHPSGDVKKICRENNSPYHNTAAGAQVWYINQWEEGVTEPGSSGSPLFDQNGRIIGQLYGGLAACSGTANNGQYDYYGRLGVSWSLGISTYLAPNSCGTAVTNDGWDPNQPTLPDDAGISGVSSPVGPYCVDNFIPEVILKNFGTNPLLSATINYDIDGGTNNTINWIGTLAPGASETVVLPVFTTTGGPHVFNAYTTSPNGTVDSNPLNDDAFSNYTATIGGQDISIEIITDCWGSEVTWEIQDGLNSVVASGGPYSDVNGGETITTDACLAIGCYDFIIDDSFGDGMYGSQYGSCSVDGTYSITQTSNSAVLATIVAANSDFGDQEINNFCVAIPCGATFDYSLIEEDCFGDADASIDISFLTGNSSGATYDMGSGPQANSNFNGLTQGNYTVTVVDGNLCSSIVDVSVTGPTALTVNTATTNTVCSGQSDGTITITATGGTPNYQYNIGTGNQPSNSFSGLAANSYVVTVTDGNNCTSITNATVNDAILVSGVVTNVTHVTSGSDGAIDITISNGNPPYSFVWSGPNGFTSNDEDPATLEPGTYSVIVTDACGDEVTLNNIVIENQVGLQEQESITFSIYPNPSNGILNLQFSEMSAESYNISIMDVTGRVVFVQNDLNNDNYILDLSNTANGTYMLLVSAGTANSIKRIVLKK